MGIVEKLLPRIALKAWEVRTRTIGQRCLVCGAPSDRRLGYDRSFLQCTACGFLWCHDFPAWIASRGMGLEGSWGGPEKGGERDDFLVRFIKEQSDRARQKVLIYGAGTTLVFRVLHDEGLDVYGADIGQDIVDYRTAEFPGRFMHTSELETSEHGFDIITACEVFEHFHDPVRWVGTLARNLAPGGVLCGSTNFYPGHGPIEDDQPTGYMSLTSHVAYWSDTAFAAACEPFGMTTVSFELECPGSVTPDLTYGSLFPNKRLFFASRDHDFIQRLRETRGSTPVLPCNTADYPIEAYRRTAQTMV
jgi:SAM-dependent methyltransferase